MSNIVSIAMPTYNRAYYLPSAIESVLSQTYAHWELVIVDDCSTDSTPEVIADYMSRDSRIKSVRHEQNRKLPGALNTGFAHSTGDYLTWLSDDDLLRPNALEAMVKFLQAHPEIGLVYTDYTEIDAQGQPIRRIVVGQPEELGIGKPVGVSHLFRRKVYEELKGYKEEMFLAEDLDFWIRAFIKFKMLPYHEDLFLYRQHSTSLTSTYQRVYRVHGKILEAYLPEMHWMNKYRTAHAYFRQAKRAMYYRDIWPAANYLLQAFRTSPMFFMKQPFIKVWNFYGKS